MAAAQQDTLCVFYRLVCIAVEIHLHVALSAEQPHIAGQYVVQLDAFPAACKGQRAGIVTRRRCPDDDSPATVVVGHGFVCRFVPTHGDAYFGSWSSLSPQLHVGMLLEYHARCEMRRQFEALRTRKRCAKSEQHYHEESLHRLLVIFGE